MRPKQLTLREARKQISRILASGETATITRPYGEVRGFIVGVPPNSQYVKNEKQKALRAAKAAFLKAWREAATAH